MSTRDDLHRLVDELDEAVLPDAAYRLTELRQRDRGNAETAGTEAAVADLRRRLPWIGSLHSGRGDLAERSEDILRNEFGIRSR
jgi:hypothetical protein